MNDSVILDRFLLCLYFMIENSITSKNIRDQVLFILHMNH